MIRIAKEVLHFNDYIIIVRVHDSRVFVNEVIGIFIEKPN